MTEVQACVATRWRCAISAPNLPSCMPMSRCDPETSTYPRRPLPSVDMLQELTQPRILGIAEQRFGIAIDRDSSVFHEDEPCAHLSGKCHFMGDDDHGHAFFGERLHDPKDLLA